jgi:hypothetical protein
MCVWKMFFYGGPCKHKRRLTKIQERVLVFIFGGYQGIAKYVLMFLITVWPNAWLKYNTSLMVPFHE